MDKPYKDLITSGSWTISQMMYQGFADTVVDYDGYTLIFTNDGEMQAINNNSISENGKWIIFTYDEGHTFKIKIEMEGDHFNYLDAMWGFASKTTSQINLEVNLTTMTLLKN